MFVAVIHYRPKVDDSIALKRTPRYGVTDVEVTGMSIDVIVMGSVVETATLNAFICSNGTGQ